MGDPSSDCQMSRTGSHLRRFNLCGNRVGGSYFSRNVYKTANDANNASLFGKVYFPRINRSRSPLSSSNLVSVRDPVFLFRRRLDLVFFRGPDWLSTDAIAAALCRVSDGNAEDWPAGFCSPR